MTGLNGFNAPRSRPFRASVAAPESCRSIRPAETNREGGERKFAAVGIKVRSADKAALPLIWWCQLHQRVLASGMDNPNSVKGAATPYALAAAGVLFASICFGFVPYFSRGLTDQGLAPYAVAFYRYILAAVVLLPELLKYRSNWREIVWGMVAGGVMGLGWVGYVTALETVPASTVGVLYMTYPVFTIVISWTLFGDRPTRRSIVAAGLIVAAAIIAGSPASVPSDQIPTLLVSLAAPFGFGFGICVLVHRLSRIAPLARIASVSLGSVIGLVPLILTSEINEILPKGGSDWFLIVGIGLITALFRN